MAFDLLEQILPHVANAVYPASIPLTHWKVKESDLADASAVSLKDKSWADFAVPSFWGGYDRTAWFRTTVTIPAQLSGQRVGLRHTVRVDEPNEGAAGDPPADVTRGSGPSPRPASPVAALVPCSSRDGPCQSDG